MLKKLTVTGILAGAATGVVLLGGPANADRLTAGPSDIPAACYYTAPGYIPPAWCASYVQTPYEPPVVYVPPAPYYPGNGWDRWHHGGWGGYPHHWHR